MTPKGGPGSPQQPVARGRAQVSALGGGTGEVWTLPAGAEAIAKRLAELGAGGVGGFVEQLGPLSLRRRPRDDAPVFAASLAPAGEVLAQWTPVAEVLAWCEERSLFPGPLSPRGLWFDVPSGRAGLWAEDLVAGLVGAKTPPRPRLTRWTPPGPAAGHPWSQADNRYVFALCLYRALCGEHAFGAKGRRLDLAEGAQRGAPPMPQRISAALPPGLHSFCLRLLQAEAANRPRSAKELVETLRGFRTAGPAASARSGARSEQARPLVPEPSPSATQRPRPDLGPRPPGRGRTRSRAWGLLPVGLGLAAASLAFWTPTPAPPPAGLRVGASAPLLPQTARADDCAACHPDHAAQWHGSVMAHSVKSPLFGALELLIQEQVGRSDSCPEGAGALREGGGAGQCLDPNTGIPLTGSGGALWCVNCHAPEENLREAMPAWNGLAARSRSRLPVTDLLPQANLDGISCAFCHQSHGPVQPGDAARGGYEGNPDWISTASGRRFLARPEDAQGKPGIGNSGYALDPESFFAFAGGELVPSGAHQRPSPSAKDYLASSEFCGACHDVRLFGSDARSGEHFKRLRNAYSEWVEWADDKQARGEPAASCQDCHMSLYPGVCVPEGEGAGRRGDPFSQTRYTALERACPSGTEFSARAPGERGQGRVSTASASDAPVASHAFAGVDVPLTPAFPGPLIDDDSLDAFGTPRGVTQRRDLLLGSTFRFLLDAPRRSGTRLEVPVELENIGAGHKVPAGFSQEREIWVHLRVTDASGGVLYEVGALDRPDEDLRDKVFARVNVDDRRTDAQGRPLGVFGADVLDGPDHPQWDSSGDGFVGRGLINLQNGFQRCVTCIGRIDAQGECQAGPGQGGHRAARFEDGDYDLETGVCNSNLRGEARFLEVYFPVGALDAERGLTKGPDAIIDERSAVAGEPQRYLYQLRVPAQGELRIEARLMFRAFPPFLIRAFAAYEAFRTRQGARPSGPQVTTDMLERLEVVELARAERVVR